MKIQFEKKSDPANSIVVNNIVLQATDRTPKDVADFISAVETSEMIYYPNRVALYDIYSRFELDAHFSGVWEKRIATVLNKNLDFFDKDGSKVDEMDWLIDSKPFRDLIRIFMMQKAWGLSGVEFIPGNTFSYIEIPRKHINPDKKVIVKNQYDSEGISYDNVWNLFIVGDQKDKGFMVSCAICLLYKQGMFGDWAQFIEIFGQPFRIFKYDVYDKKTKEEASNLLKSSGSATSMILPKQLEFDAKDGKQTNSEGGLQDKFRNACNDEISTVVLGNTETTNSSRSSGYAQASVHQEQQDEIIKKDLADIENLLNDSQFIAILKSYGYPVEGGYFNFEEQVSITSLSARKDIDIALSNVIPIDDDYFYETYGIPKPDNYDALKKEMNEKKQVQTQQPTPSISKSQTAKKEKEEPTDSLWKRFTDFFGQAR